jgi:endonuclease/exonuclease/phosphatase family metal-dependent hydrolase
MEVTAIKVILASKPVEILVVYLSPSRSVIAWHLSAFLGGCIPVLVIGDLNPKPDEWNSKLMRRSERFFCDHA